MTAAERRDHTPDHRDRVNSKPPCDNSLTAGRKSLILKGRDVRVVEGARLEIALTVCDGVLQILITVAKPAT
jgi:hypothetical protein